MYEPYHMVHMEWHMIFALHLSAYSISSEFGHLRKTPINFQINISVRRFLCLGTIEWIFINGIPVVLSANHKRIV